MSVTAELADGTTLEFPDGTDPAVVQATVKKRMGLAASPASSTPSASPAPSQDELNRAGIFGGIPEAAVSLGSGALAGPVSGLAGIAGAMLPGPPGQGADWVQKVQDAMTVQPVSRGGKMIVNAASFLPGKLAGGADWAGAKTSDVAGPAAGAAVNAALQTLPYAFLPKIGGAAGDVLKGNTPFIGARDLMTRALKPNREARMSGEAERAVTTLLGQDDAGAAGLVRSGNLEKTRDQITDLEKQRSDLLAPSGARVPVSPVLDELHPQLDAAMKDTTPAGEKRIQEIQDAWDAVVNNREIAGQREVPVQLAQEFKLAINPKVKGEYGQGPSPQAIENAKAVRRGWAQGVENAVPDVGGLNRLMGPRINAADLMSERLGAAGVREPFGWALLAHDPKTFAMMVAQRSPLATSLIAHMLNKGGNLAVGAGEMAGPAGVAMAPEMDERARKKRLKELLRGSQ